MVDVPGGEDGLADADLEVRALALAEKGDALLQAVAELLEGVFVDENADPVLLMMPVLLDGQEGVQGGVGVGEGFLRRGFQALGQVADEKQVADPAGEFGQPAGGRKVPAWSR